MDNKTLDLKELKITPFSFDDAKIENISKKEIAVIGMAGKIAAAGNLEEFWTLLKTGRDCIRKIPGRRRADIDNYLRIMGNLEPETVELSELAYLEEIDCFDYQFFSLSPKEAGLMDPYQRIFLETVWNTIEDGGYGGKKLRGTKTGLYVGYTYPFGGDYQSFINAVDPQSSALAVPGNIKALIASRISYILDLKGPAMLIDTACSSSLVAVHLACQAIRNGECDQAIAGGINIAYFTLKGGEGLGIESSNGRTRTFDDGSDGTGSGEGTAAVFLKPLSRAIKDRDSIYAVIKGSCINQDGSSVGITAPNTKAQEELILSAWKDAGINPETISYIEAHGTGTKLGDPIEIDGIRRAFRKHTSKKQFCAIGSAKTNVGHLNSAAGITGFIKAALALKHQEIPPSIHFQQPNRKIDFENSPVYVNDKLTKWETNGFPRRCGVSAFGLSGTNCHIILEEAQVLPERLVRTQIDEPKLQVLALSAKSQYSMVELIKAYQAFLERAGAIQLNDLCYTANTGKGHYNYRLAIICKDLPDLQAKLQKLKGGNTFDITDPHIFYGEHVMIPVNKKQKEPGDLLEAEKKQLDNLAEATIQQITANGQGERLADLCQLYIKGAEIKWEELADLRQVSTVNLPVYPFDRKRCWLEVPEITAAKDENLYHAANWKREALIPSEVEILENKNILIFHGEDETGAELVKRLRSAGCRVIEVKIGSGFGRETENSYTIGLKPEDYDELWREIKSCNISAIVHTMTCGAGLTNLNNMAGLEELLQRGVYSLYHLVRALHRNRLKERLNIFLIARYAHEVTQKEALLYPENAAFFGLGKVIAQEYPKLICRCIDIDNDECINLIMRELQFKTGPYLTVFREGECYQEIIEKVDVHEVKEEAINIKEQGVYLITGGTGGIGLELGRYLAAQKKVNLVLLSRRGMPERGSWDSILKNNGSGKIRHKIKTILDIEAMGSKVILYRVDVADENAMKTAIGELRKNYGPINGIIHGAGVAGDGYIINRDQTSFNEVFCPKVQGTWLLDHLTKDDPLDFLVLCSSLATVTGVPGQGDYTAANAYLDAFAFKRRRQGKKTVTINWTQWSEVGMALDYDRGNDPNGVFRPITNQKAVMAFDRVLNRNIARIFVGEINYGALAVSLKDLQLNLSAEIIKIIKNTSKVPSLDHNYPKAVNLTMKGGVEGGYTGIQKKLAQFWAGVLGLEEISIYDNFHELGGDSILATHLVRAMEPEFPGLIDVADVFSHPTIAEMADYLAKELETKSKPAVSDMAEILDKLIDGELSIDEAAVLMETAGDKIWRT